MMLSGQILSPQSA